MMFSSHIDMIYKNSAVRDIFLKLLLSSIGSPRRYHMYEKVMSDYISTNSEIHHQFQIYYKGAKVSQLWASSCLRTDSMGSKWQEIRILVTLVLTFFIKSR